MNAPKDKPDKAAATASRPTLKTISHLSGFAVPTVSRALGDAPDIGQKTKEIVRRIADEIGYVPNRAGLRLRTGRTHVISLTISTQHGAMDHTAGLISGVASALRDTPYHLNVTPELSGDDPMQAVRYIVETGSADAIILNRTTPQDPRIAYLMEKQFPFATHGRTNWHAKHPYFDFDNKAFAYLGVKRMAQRGRSNVFAILPPLAQYYSRCMADGIQQAIAETAIKVRTCERVNSDWSATSVRDRLVEALLEDPAIDGIFCGSPATSMAAIDAVESTSTNRDHEVDIFGKEFLPFVSLFRRELLSMPEDVRHAGVFLGKAVLQAIHNPDLSPMQGLEQPDEASLVQISP